EFFKIWDDIESALPPCPQGFVHGDFHLENMILQENAEGYRKCALIDYQDAFLGPLSYDLVNLLEDARISVPQDLQQDILADFCGGMNDNEKENFLNWYRVMGTQFHCRVLGLFIMLAAEQGRDEYLVHIPRLQNYVLEALKHPVLSPFKDWCIKEGLDFKPVKSLNGEAIRILFASK
ncbi:MAG: phosphotransferase, partial [Alphaproteobacteria bacterium]|nr:phosphotransferase [Alphaproteobacteria bacterium]